MIAYMLREEEPAKMSSKWTNKAMCHSLLRTLKFTFLQILLQIVAHISPPLHHNLIQMSQASIPLPFPV